MNTDIRLSVGFWSHPKTKKLIRRTGLEGARSLQVLWLWAAVNRPDGNLSGMDDEELELAADWNGEEGRFVGALVDGRLLDGGAGERRVHGWLEHNSWQSGDSDRADCGRFNVLKSKMKDVHAKLAEAGINRLTKVDYEELKVPSKTGAVLARLLKQAAKQPQSNPEATPEAPLEATPSTLEVDLSKPLRSPTPTPSPSPSPTPCSPSESINCASGDAQQAKPKRTSKLSDQQLKEFDKFWDAFDYKRGRAGAEKAWGAIRGMDDALLARILEAASQEAARRPALEARGMTPKMAQGWLSDRRWEDEYSTPAQAQRPYVPRGQPQGMTWGEIRNEKNKQACRNALKEFLAEKGIAVGEEEYGQPDDDPWTATVNE